MKKLKYLLFLVLAAIAAVGVLAGCSSDYVSDADTGVTPYTLTYCANGGLLTTGIKGISKYEAIFRVMDGVQAFDPSVDTNIVAEPSRPGYIFMGWAKGKVDEEGKPALLDEPLNGTLDGSIHVNKFGSLGPDITDKTGTERICYYDYDRNDLWDFSKDKVTENTCLVAVWENYNKYIIAQRDDSGEWEDYDDVLADDFVLGEGPVYEKYADRFVNARGTGITESALKEAYQNARPNHTALKFYKDEACTEEITFPFIVNDLVTIIYYKEVEYEGIFELVSNARDFNSAISNGKNIYLMGDIEDVKSNNGDYSANMGNMCKSAKPYTGEIRGNGYSITGVMTAVDQVISERGSFNKYGGFFGELKGAQIYDLNIEYTTRFTIGVDPTNALSGASSNDSECHFGLFASVMNGCVFHNVKVNVKYEVVRSIVDGESYVGPDGKLVVPQVPNTYDVDVKVYNWAPRSINQMDDTYNSDITIFDDDCVFECECTKDER